MRIQGEAKVADFLEDFIVYRCLEPADSRLPGLRYLAGELNLNGDTPPRKNELDYARVIVRILRAAQSLVHPEISLKQLIYVGDSQLDGQAFLNIIAEGTWQGWAFIGKDDSQQSPKLTREGDVYYGNRWANLPEFLELIQQDGAVLDASGAVVVDLDKTFLGPRGRNDTAIDLARSQAAIRVARNVLGDASGEERFAAVYHEMNQSKYHFFTLDNQDYLVYCALMIAAELYPFSDFQTALSEKTVANFADFLDIIERNTEMAISSDLRAIHQEVAGNFKSGDPTPFKSFRRQEYLTTTERMRTDSKNTDWGSLLKVRITINSEVAQILTYLKQRNALILGLSDKPDEAVFPTELLAAQGRKPLHHISTLVVGEKLNLTQF